MPRYFFNVHDGAEYPDLQGTELADLNAARQEAVRFSGELLTDSSDRFWGTKEWSMEVCDDAGLALFTLRFAATEMPSAAKTPYVPPAS